MIANSHRRHLGTFLRAALIAAAVAAPMLAVQNVRAGTSQFIGETPSMSSGAGLVLMVSLQRS
ncbi:MAG: hypothetical protein KDJ43_09165 [Rhizobiaceae bacterium]|nr:hypothetical protein [Rhizobiaceae bacterium]